MSTEWQPVMMSAISEVLETMFFLSIDFECSDPTSPAFCCSSQIDITLDGRVLVVALRATEPFARTLAGNLLGMDEDEVSEPEIEDVMKEVANMVGGNYMGRIGGARSELGIPSFRRLGEDGNETLSGLPLSFFGEWVGMVTLQDRSVQEA